MAEALLQRKAHQEQLAKMLDTAKQNADAHRQRVEELQRPAPWHLQRPGRAAQTWDSTRMKPARQGIGAFCTVLPKSLIRLRLAASEPPLQPGFLHNLDVFPCKSNLQSFSTPEESFAKIRSGPNLALETCFAILSVLSSCPKCSSGSL